MNIGVSSYSLHPYMNKTGCDIFKAIDKAAEIGYKEIEFISTYAPENISAVEHAKIIKEYCQSKKLKITAYTIGADLLLENEDDRLIEELDIAKAFGVTFMRHDISSGFAQNYVGKKTYDDLLPVVVPKIRKITEKAESMGIKTMTENHGFFSQDSERVEKLVNEVNNQNFGILIDIGNFYCADENSAIAVGRLLPFVFHVHVKDFFFKNGQLPNPGKGWFLSRGGNYLRGTIVGHGDVPVVQCLNQIKLANFTGSYSIEFEGMEEPEEALIIGFENLTRFLI